MSPRIRVILFPFLGLSLLFGLLILSQGVSAAPFQSVLTGTTIHEPLVLGAPAQVPRSSALETGGIPPWWLLVLILLLFIPAAVFVAARRHR